MKRNIEKIYTMKMYDKEFDLIASSLKRGLEEKHVKLFQLEATPLQRRKEKDKIKILQRELFDSIQAYESFTGEKIDMYQEEGRVRKELGINARETTSNAKTN